MPDQHVTIVVIALILFAFSEMLKTTVFKKNDDLKTSIPYICTILGCIIGAAIYFLQPELLGAKMTVISATVSGGFSGLIATGGHQIFKQFQKRLSGEEDEEEKKAENKDKSDDE